MSPRSSPRLPLEVAEQTLRVRKGIRPGRYLQRVSHADSLVQQSRSSALGGARAVAA
eukprot:CAMPEP_0115425778 /NCGR_PEP_ID=MMETSP0271-20121206/28564_1 /TAXON_ID=71861 /ORGANISM="Scrippsiella trochoidea, Strain CCMP3099" /LENGTH=56 /DNA_ID=CAMNT_0002850705 /DNA_START=119 /DNA_END=285 /DNA_ORIENTATION=+